MKYRIVIEKAGEGYSAYVPDLPGCITTGATREDVGRAIAEAIAFHLDGKREDGELLSGDPFVAFTEWAGEADTAAYADL